MILELSKSKDVLTKLDIAESDKINENGYYIFPDKLYFDYLPDNPSLYFKNLNIFCQSECLAQEIINFFPKEKLKIIHINISEYSFSKVYIDISSGKFFLSSFEHCKFSNIDKGIFNECFLDNELENPCDILFKKNEQLNESLNNIPWEYIPISLDYPNLKIIKSKINGIISSISQQIKQTLIDDEITHIFFSGYWVINELFIESMKSTGIKTQLNTIDEFSSLYFSEILKRGLINFIDNNFSSQEKKGIVKVEAFLPEKVLLNFNYKHGALNNYKSRTLLQTFIHLEKSNYLLRLFKDNKYIELQIKDVYKELSAYYIILRPELGIDAFNRNYLKVLDEYYIV